MTNGRRFDDTFDDIDIPVNEYISNLESEGYFAEEELPEEDEMSEEETFSEKDEYLSSRGGELVANLSAMFDVETEGIGQNYWEGRFVCERCNCGPGEACRWQPSSTYYSLLGEKIEHETIDVLGLRMWETWRLPCDKISEESIRVRYQGGQGTFDLWNYPESLLTLENEQVCGLCSNDTLWLIRGTCGPNLSRLWLGKLAEATRFQIIRYQCTGYQVLTASEHADKVQWNGCSYWIYCRLVEWKFEAREILQTEAAVAVWSSRHEEDDSAYEASNFLTSLHDATGRGFLRYIY